MIFRKVKLALSWMLLLAVISCTQKPEPTVPGVSELSPVSRKKLIYIGWEQPSCQILSQKYRMMETTSPFDGITLIIKDTIDGVAINEDKFFSKHEIKREWLQRSLDNLKSCDFKQFTDNFVRVNTVPESLSWTDDASWAIVARNMGNVAWFAKEGGLKGICYDPESYSGKLFQWDPTGVLSYEVNKMLARQRGRELMTEIGKEYPDVTFWGLFLMSLGRSAADSPDIDAAFSSDVYALYPSFINGLMDALPPGAKMVEGNEDAYYCPDREELLSLYTDSKGKLSRFVSPENIAKFRTQYSVGFGFYIDMYSNKNPNGRFYFGEQNNRSRIERFRDRLQEGIQISDEYVWVYNESYRWWDIPYADEKFNAIKKDSLWKDVFPQINDYSEFAKNSQAYLSRVLGSGKKIDGNLAVNGSFDEVCTPAVNKVDWSNEKCPLGFLRWSGGGPGEIELANNDGINGTACAKLCGDESYLIQHITVTPNEKYVFAADGRKTGGGLKTGIYWLDNSGNLLRWYQWKYFPFLKINESLWLQSTGIVTVPDDIHSLVILIIPQASEKTDTFWVDNVRVYPLNEIFKLDPIY